MTDERQKIITILENKVEELKVMSDEEYAKLCELGDNFYTEFANYQKTIGAGIRHMSDDELAEFLNTICIELEEAKYSEWDKENGKKCWEMWLGWEFSKPLRPWWDYGFGKVKE